MKLQAFCLATLLAACRPSPPPNIPPPPDAPPTGARDTLGGKPTTEKPVSAAAVDFDKAVKIDVTFDGAKNAVVASIHLEPGFHAYGPGEETGKPLAMELTGDAWTPGAIELPKGEVKDLGEMGKSVVVTGDVKAVMGVQPKAGQKGPITGNVRYQVCSETSCDRPRAMPFTLNAS